MIVCSPVIGAKKFLDKCQFQVSDADSNAVRLREQRELAVYDYLTIWRRSNSAQFALRKFPRFLATTFLFLLSKARSHLNIRPGVGRRRHFFLTRDETFPSRALRLHFRTLFFFQPIVASPTDVHLMSSLRHGYEILRIAGLLGDKRYAVLKDPPNTKIWNNQAETLHFQHCLFQPVISAVISEWRACQ